MKLSEKKKLGLVLSGGGIKAAAFHIGVCLALREKGFKFAGGNAEEVAEKFPEDKLTFKTYVGSSAGAIIATFLSAGFPMESIIQAFTQGAGFNFTRKSRIQDIPYLKPITYKDLFSLNLKVGMPIRFVGNLFKKRPVISGGIEVLLKQGFKVNGIFNADNIEQYLREHVVDDNEFSSLGIKLFIVATQLNHSRKVIFGDYDKTIKKEHIKYAGYSKISEATAASASLPPFFAPYGIKNDNGKVIHFFDGEIRDTLSTHVASDHGCDLVIASYSMQPYHYNSEMGSLSSYGIPLILNQALYQVIQQKIDKHIRHQKQIDRLIKAVDGYLNQANIAPEHREKLLEILIQKTNYRPNVTHIYIHPSPQDYQMFFVDHFSLNPKILTRIVRTGFKAAMSAMRQYNI